MKKYYATITRKDGTQLTIGEYSKKEIQKTLKDIHKKGIVDLDKASVNISVVII